MLTDGTLIEQMSNLVVATIPTREMTIREFGEHIIRFTGSASTLESKPLPADDPTVRRPDITRAKALLGWEPKVTFEEGIVKTIEFFKGRVAAGDIVA